MENFRKKAGMAEHSDEERAADKLEDLKAE